MKTFRRLAATLLLLLVASAAAAYTVYLKDGSKIIAREEFTIEDDKAIIVLLNGTRTSIAASEIDLPRTRDANEGNIGSALVIEEGRVTELPADSAEPRRSETLSDLIAKREVGPGSRPVTPRSTPTPPAPDASERSAGPVTDYRTLPRRPFGHLEAAGEVQRLFRAQGVEEILIYQGTEPGRLLLDISTNSEAAVFRALEAAASTLLHIRGQYPEEVAAFELALSTVERDPAGQFLMTPEIARPLAENEMEPSAFFVAQVRF